MMKAVCYTKKWIEEVSIQRGEQFSARIFVLKLGPEDPSQYTSMVNAIFAAQKLKIQVDSLLIQKSDLGHQQMS